MAMIVEYPAMSNRCKKRWIKGLVVALVLLTVAEVALRTVRPGLSELSLNSYWVEGLQVRRPRPQRLWSDPDTGRTHTVAWDDLGLRVDGRRAFDPAPDRRTLLMLGDSYVESLQVPGGGTMDSMMEKLLDLADPDGRWQVLNAGLNGSTIDDQWLFLKQLTTEVRPQTVIQFVSPNDLDGLAHSKTSVWEPPSVSMTPQSHSLMKTLGHLYLVQGIRKLMAGRQTRALHDEVLGGTALETRAHATELDAETSRIFEHWGAVLQKERAWLLDKGVELILVEVPVPDDWIVPERKRGRLMVRHGELCDLLGVPFKRLFPVFDANLGFPEDAEAFGKVRGRMFFETDPHWNSWGNLIVAMELASNLLQKDVSSLPAVQDYLIKSVRP